MKTRKLSLLRVHQSLRPITDAYIPMMHEFIVCCDSRTEEVFWESALCLPACSNSSILSKHALDFPPERSQFLGFL